MTFREKLMLPGALGRNPSEKARQIRQIPMFCKMKLGEGGDPWRSPFRVSHFPCSQLFKADLLTFIGGWGGGGYL